MTSEDHIAHINDIISNFASSLTTEQHSAALRVISQARENIEWLKYHGDSISEWLIVYANGNSSGNASFISINSFLLLFSILSLKLLFV